MTGTHNQHLDVNERLGRVLDDVHVPEASHSSLGYFASAEYAAQWQEYHILVRDK